MGVSQEITENAEADRWAEVEEGYRIKSANVNAYSARDCAATSPIDSSSSALNGRSAQHS